MKIVRQVLLLRFHSGKVNFILHLTATHFQFTEFASDLADLAFVYAGDGVALLINFCHGNAAHFQSESDVLIGGHVRV